MGYWIEAPNIIAFLKKYSYVILAIAIIAVAAGTFSGYSTYLVSLSQHNLTATELLPACEGNLADCISAKSNTEAEFDKCKTEFDQCKKDVDRAFTLLEGLSAVQSDLSFCRSDLSTLQQQLSDSLSKVSALLSNATECEQNLVSCQDSLSVCRNETQSLLTNITNCQNELNALKTSFNTLAQNAANKICCGINPALKYFYISDSKIVCAFEANETLGTKELVCP